MLHRLSAMLCALLLLCTGVTASAENDFIFSFMPTREYEGVTYEGRTSAGLTTVLLIGYDHQDMGEVNVEADSYTHGGQSDFLLVLAIDHDARQIRQLQIDRDTITEVVTYSKNGVYLGLRRTQICLAHAYGNTQELNNFYTIWAVENLLKIADEDDGAQIDLYLSMDITGIGRLNDLLGGITVPIQDDFSYYDTTMVPGTTMTLNGDQAQVYCRQRHYVGDGSNEARMSRQRIYMDEAVSVLKKRLQDEPAFAKELLNGMGMIFDTRKPLDEGFGFTTTDQSGTPVTSTPTHYLMTNKSLDYITSLLLKTMDYEVLPVEELAGTHTLNSNGYIEFRMEEDAAPRWALDALYRRLN